MITQSGNNTGTDRAVAFVGVMVLPVGLAVALIWAAVAWISSL